MSASTRERLGIWLLIVAASLAAFSPALENEFVGWDDGFYILTNPGIRSLRGENFAWMLNSTRGGLWQPLAWLSLAVDYAMFGFEPSGYHLTNILLHAGAALLLFAVGLELFGRGGFRRHEDAAIAAALCALFFAVHPLRVESVAWATERKGLLSGFFCAAAVLAHLRSARAGRRRAAWEAGGLAAFALSLSAKAAGLTLPLALLVLEVHPLGRLPADPRRWREPACRRVLVPIAAYLALAAAAASLNLVTAINEDVIRDSLPLGAAWRLGKILYGLCFYPAKTLWPGGLSPLYPPRAWFGSWSWELFGFAALISSAAALLLWRRRRFPAALAAFACYGALILPMLGFVQQGHLYAAGDRFSKAKPMQGMLLFGAAFAGAGRAARGAALVWLAALGVASWRQCAVWRDSITFWSSTYAREPGEVSLSALAGVLVEDGRREGLPLLERAIALYPKFSSNYENLGIALQSSGDEAGARAVWRRGLALAPNPLLEARLGASLANESGWRFVQGTLLMRAALSQGPVVAAWRTDLADAYVRAGHYDDAEREYAVAVALVPTLGRAWNNWGLSLARRGRNEDAALRYRAALCDVGTRAQAHHNWGNLLLGVGRLAEAERHYREALRIDPGLAQASVNLGNILARRGLYRLAAQRYQAALRREPGLAEARANLAAVSRFLRR